FLFCCEMPEAQALTETDNCPLAKASHCAKQSTGESVSQFASFQIDSQMRDCCRFLPNIFDEARKVESNSLAAEAAQSVKISSPEFSIVESNFAAPKFYRPLVLDRGGTYLKNRVFRI
ncbi:MAG TPA: hypothetical protein VGD05_01095, partial [Pyrinomonadaceae bacterium]